VARLGEYEVTEVELVRVKAKSGPKNLISLHLETGSPGKNKGGKLGSERLESNSRGMSPGSNCYALNHLLSMSELGSYRLLRSRNNIVA